MVLLTDILLFINEYLNIKSFRDYCPNGLQVEGKPSVGYICSGVSASLELFKKASEIGSDLVLTHHGLLWGNKPQIVSGSFKKRLDCLLKANISLLSYHLPLDAHNIVGNNSIIASKLGLVDIEPFAKYYDSNIGCMGNLPYAMDFDIFLKKVNKIFNSDGLYFSFGKSEATRIAIVSGAAADYLSEAIDKKCDVFITGEAKEATMYIAKEGQINFIASGHYNTEKFGVEAVSKLIAKEFSIRHSFIDIPNPI